MNMLHRKIHENDDFVVSNKTRSKTRNMENRQKIRRCGIVVLDNHLTTCRPMDVSRRAVSDRLREMEKIQKTGRWVPHELNG